MRILALIQGQYGERIVENIRQRSPQGWKIEATTVPRALPPIVDEPADFLPSGMPQADLLLSLTESSSAAQLIPAAVGLSGAKSVISPIDNSAWLPVGLRNQLRRELADMGVAAVFPKTFCTLTENSAGFRADAESHDDAHIASFASQFGRPRLQITVDPHNRSIVEVVVKRGSPCGSTHFAAERMAGMASDDAIPRAGLIVHHYPCLASMQPEQIDEELTETLMHVSGYVMNEEVERGIGQHLICPKR